jgi:hypothetical protein
VDKVNDLRKYLGILVITGKKEMSSYAFIVDKVKNKLSGWKSISTLSLLAESL